jgi:hypothetical protein
VDLIVIISWLPSLSLSFSFPPSSIPLSPSHFQEGQFFGVHVDLLNLVLSSSQLYPQYFNGAQFFQGDHTDQRTAAGGMYIIMGFLWLVGIPVVVVAIIMVRITHVLCTDL